MVAVESNMVYIVLVGTGPRYHADTPADSAWEYHNIIKIGKGNGVRLEKVEGGRQFQGQRVVPPVVKVFISSGSGTGKVTIGGVT